MNKIKRALRGFWYKIQVRAYTAVWGERRWYDYPLERWWQRYWLIRYTIKWRLGQLGNFIFSLWLATAVVVTLVVILMGACLATTPATAWVRFDEGNATLNVLFKNSITENQQAAFLYTTIRTVGQWNMATATFSCADVRGHLVDYFSIPVKAVEIVNITVVMKMEDGQLVTIVPGLNMAVGESGWEIPFRFQR